MRRRWPPGPGGAAGPGWRSDRRAGGYPSVRATGRAPSRSAGTGRRSSADATSRRDVASPEPGEEVPQMQRRAVTRHVGEALDRDGIGGGGGGGGGGNSPGVGRPRSPGKRERGG